MEPAFNTEHQDGDSKSAANPECTKLVDIGDVEIEIEIETPPQQPESARHSMSRSAIVIAIIKSWTKQYEYRTFRKTLLTAAILAIVLIVVLLNVSDFTGSEKTGDSTFVSIKDDVFSDIDPERFSKPETDETINDEYFLQKEETSLEADPIQIWKLEPSKKRIFCGTDKLNSVHAAKHSNNMQRKRSRKQNKNRDSEEMELNMTIETADSVENLKHMKLPAASQSPSSVVSVKSLLLLNQDVTSSEKFLVDDPSVVTELNIDEGISPALLKKIVEKYPSLEKLTIHMDQFCSRENELNKLGGNTNENQENNSQEQRLPSIVFKNVVSFTIQNKHNPDINPDGNFNNESHCPALYKWIFTWKFPQLKNLEINSMNLDEGLFESVHGLLEETKQTMSTITVLNSYICDECFFSDVDYARIQMVKILGRRETPFPTFPEAEASYELLDEDFY